MMSPDREHDVVYTSNRYIEYHSGSLNVILSVPHGGRMKPKSIPDRDAGAYVKGRVVYDHKYHNLKDPQNYPVRYKSDLNTKELGILIANELCKILGKRPHIVICNLHRGKLDCNSDFEKATFNIPEAQQAWHDFHNFIKNAKGSFKDGGILFDLHGHSHGEGFVELGYTISSEDLDSVNYSSACMSIANLVQRHSHQNCLQHLVSGEMSFGGLLASEGYKTIPSPQHPSPRGLSYYSGGYNTNYHGSRHGGDVDAIQIESPIWVRGSAEIEGYAKALARCMAKYLSLYFSKNIDVQTNQCESTCDGACAKI